MFDGKSVLLTGGTGSFGRKCVGMLLAESRPSKLSILSRDEYKQLEMQQQFNEVDHPCLRYLIGDVRDRNRLYRAFRGVDFVIHAAALKQVPAIEYNPFEAVKTNIIGAENVINAAIDNDVGHVIALSTDKAVAPVNLYGASKLCSDKLFVASNAYSGAHKTRLSVVRYGNVIGSRGSIIPLLLERRSTGVIPITDERMTRFWITLEQSVRFVFDCFKLMRGGEIFVPKIPSMSLVALAGAIAPDCEQKIIGIRPGEKLHEVLISSDDARHTVVYEDFYVIKPEFHWWSNHQPIDGGCPVAEGFSYSSDTNERFLSAEELTDLVGDL